MRWDAKHGVCQRAIWYGGREGPSTPWWAATLPAISLTAGRLGMVCIIWYSLPCPANLACFVATEIPGIVAAEWLGSPSRHGCRLARLLQHLFLLAFLRHRGCHGPSGAHLRYLGSGQAVFVDGCACCETCGC